MIAYHKVLKDAQKYLKMSWYHSTPGPWLVDFFRSGKNLYEPNPQHLSDAFFKAQPVMKPNFRATPAFYSFRS